MCDQYITSSDKDNFFVFSNDCFITSMGYPVNLIMSKPIPIDVSIDKDLSGLHSVLALLPYQVYYDTGMIGINIFHDINIQDISPLIPRTYHINSISMDRDYGYTALYLYMPYDESMLFYNTLLYLHQ